MITFLPSQNPGAEKWRPMAISISNSILMILKYKFRKGATTEGDGSEAATPTTDPTESAATVALRRLW